MGYQRFFQKKHYTFPELLQHCQEVKRSFPTAQTKFCSGKVELLLKLKPTSVSIEYEIKLVARKNKKSVDIFVVNTKIERYENKRRVPHMYSDGSLCLYYPKYNEWSYTDSWAETLIPWTSLWLFYYEIWIETGEWLGGGIHLDK